MSEGISFFFTIGKVVIYLRIFFKIITQKYAISLILILKQNSILISQLFMLWYYSVEA